METFININERAYKYIRQFTIKSVDDALIELITNSIDAYNKTSYIERDLIIEIIDSKIIKVRDFALGLTSEELGTCFLQVGNYTACDSSRGFFSRGSKDITAIGNLTFDAIKNSKYSQCKLNTDAYGSVTIMDEIATKDIREEIGIDEPNNGLQVSIDLLPNFQYINISNLYRSLVKTASLRDIMSDKRNKIILKQYDNNELVYEKKLTYDYAPGTLLLDIQYNVPDYPDKTARLVIYKVDQPFEQPVKESEMEFGFVIKDSTSIYEVGTIDDRFRWNPYINYIYGYLFCDGIHELLIDFDKNGISDKNPYPIIDPSRLTGVNKLHPFIINLFSIPLVRIDGILRQLNTSISNALVTIDEISDLLNELSDVGLEILDKNDFVINYTPSYDEELARSIQNDRSKYVTYETSYVMDDNYSVEKTEITNYIKENILKMENGNVPSQYYYILDNNNDLYQIKDYNINDPNNSPINIIQLIHSNMEESVKTNPYIYNLDNNGDVMKLYIFDKGAFDFTNGSIPVTVKNKQLSIQFINDINMVNRYNIDYSNGVNVQINLNNQQNLKYLVRQPITPPITHNTEISNMQLSLGVENNEQNISIDSYTSTQSLIFFKETFTNIIAHLIMDNDVKTGKLLLDSSSINNSKKTMDYYNKIVSSVEIKVDHIFSKYIDKLKTSKIEILNNSLDTLTSYLQNKGIVDPNIDSIKNDIQNLMTSTVE